MRGRMPGWVSRADRTEVSIPAALHIAGREVPVTVVDLSQAGCKVRCPQMFPIGEIVQLALPAFQPNAAAVRWSIPGLAGLRFISG